jgi:hypothetical protein
VRAKIIAAGLNGRKDGRVNEKPFRKAMGGATKKSKPIKPFSNLNWAPVNVGF